MLTANDVAKYIVSLTNNNIEDEISNLKLQKLLYYLQGFHLAIKGEPIFEDEIEAWQYGPVVCDTYHTYKDYGHNAIILPKEDNDYENITLETKKFISRIYSYYSQFSAIKLMNMTHEETPWDDCYNHKKSHVIEKESLKCFFQEHELVNNFIELDKANEMKKAAQFLLPDYLFDKSLTEFSQLDTDDFYES